jgi:hypothetical protein
MSTQTNGGITTVSAAFFSAISFGHLTGSARSQSEHRKALSGSALPQ